MPIAAPPVRDILALLPEMLITLAACVVLLVDIGTQRQYKQRLGWGCIGAVLFTFLVMALLPLIERVPVGRWLRWRGLRSSRQRPEI